MLAQKLFMKGGFGHEDTWNTSPEHYREGWEDIANYVFQLMMKSLFCGTLLGMAIILIFVK